ncbi:2-succinyl-5-enolpyruvyl-6-hydroxy-3-cyclohexene-1-carboxylic-acid synthase [Natrialbaceae archaeon AArc-T1-2]|uniref:2-succinyl-5-enolpyruvyl-6-hydroxy-3- cyclohexene-1-carboxylic-acid synthase n=1 Tax=Natrialbaceae archaeon AArc-T1-2 TaxID=3053904 RepID=UPI00255AD3A8|nr:2-succinyl-5-enolpyruvyl-6-hydroxy-3-cyclohexene-1-carboxylic-acid synthase [Natrialbaceae archaeon AArc-T1-2]WIV67867.1 2-succinyl-5-enolpyruvyl-6-hydroxy-3-cyclohexene-1-carboxylic-acid synthase [Natrialbaceae archaeon AArc-T1-2]
MTAPNRATLWGRVLVDELAAGGLEAVCLAPGSRSTPLTVAFAAHPDVEVYSHLDERSAAFFALGRGRRTGEPTALVCTSGTAAANFHPAVIEASQARVPLLVLTADRPPELRDSGANQTIDQLDLYGDAVRWEGQLPEPEADERKVRSVRTTAARALAKTTQTPAGPVHLNCPFRKPLEPVEVPSDVPEDFGETLAGGGRDGPFVETSGGRTRPDQPDVELVANALEDAARPLLVAGPADPPGLDADALAELATAVDAPILADPLSGVRFGSHVVDVPVFGGYDAYLEAVPDPDVVVRTGASPTSKSLRQYLRDADARQFLVDPAGEWREATFTATDLLAVDPELLLAAVCETLADCDATSATEDGWLERFRVAEDRHWAVTDEACEPGAVADAPFEGAILAAVLEGAPDPATVFVSNSMPVRDADRFGRPREAALTVLANRGASGIDGITSTALGAGSATTEPLVCVLGDLAFYHDMNGLLALSRCGVDATIVLLDNDGGGIFHQLPIEAFDPPFTEQFKTPHGLAFDPVAELYDLEFERISPSAFADAYRASLSAPGTQVLAVEFDAEASHRRREELQRRVRDALET